MTERKKPNFRKFLLVALMVTVGAGLILFTGALAWIGFETYALEQKAVAAFPGGTDATQSMLGYINDASLPLSDRNEMVWAIGRKSDRDALPALLALYTGQPCDHDAYLCQYELSKAINRCGGSVQFAYADRRWNR